MPPTLLFALVLWLTPAAAEQPAAQAAALTPQELVRIALADQVRVDDLLRKYSYSKHVVSEVRNPKGKVTARAERIYHYRPCDGKRCVDLVSVNGAPPTQKELREHNERIRKMWEQEAKKTAREKQSEEDEDLFLSRDMLAIYDFAMAANESYQGRLARVVTFTPRDEKVQLADKSNKILTRMAGRMWLAEEEPRILGQEMRMVKPIKVWAGLAGGINSMTVQQEYVVDAGMYLPKKNVVVAEYRTLMDRGKLTVIEEYSGYTAPPPAAAP